jgi:hypothetical protein
VNLARLLDEGRFVVTGELVPPRSADPGVVAGPPGACAAWSTPST